MIIDLVDKLINRCIDLARESQRVRHALAETHLDPIFKQLEEVHRLYLASFLSYRNTIASKPGLSETLNTVEEQIRVDAIYQRGYRALLQGLGGAASDPLLGPFVTALGTYLAVPLTAIARRNAIRESLSTDLREARDFPDRYLTDDDRLLSSDWPEDQKAQLAAVRAVDRVADSLQDEYARVLEAYTSLRASLLS